LGTWISADPLTIHGLGADLNPYAYVHGRTMNAVDPSGLCEQGSDCSDSNWTWAFGIPSPGAWSTAGKWVSNLFSGIHININFGGGPPTPATNPGNMLGAVAPGSQHILAAMGPDAVWSPAESLAEPGEFAAEGGPLGLIIGGGLLGVWVAKQLEQAFNNNAALEATSSYWGALFSGTPNDESGTEGGAPPANPGQGTTDAPSPRAYPTGDGTTPPEDGWQWRGPDAPGGERGGWVNPQNPRESLHPDLGHGPPDGPHWDWNTPDGGRFRLFPDGRVVPKP